MTEDAVFTHLQAMSANLHAQQIHSCKVSAPQQLPWGRSYRVVEWTLKHDPESRRRAVPAEYTATEIAELVISHVPGRRFCQQTEQA
ncbi:MULTISPECIES: DUF2866 domain-containing protein [Paraburkholderia]|uniref:DUF2866 domain-containing protein n=1 Tax=Paraburkholderia megapolitana TaxID=420953 RepID=A0A1I3QFN9_9BURK|nr:MULTISPECIES: DUF2866 domain-containing protein [Paraburkholderia]MCX4163094.1 DUF2866 domain-containing protein [Paraburkholderia megapolitana]MDN7158590.1 DUF2866 domain-containing protein [Paraburkholderia sp. CHISQ3]MDQ6495637.1 DUF2866 domain-containing protein [Paraburkholderia megapolitana]QDQ81200.1 DUF2866 domain-containing protein [Paraburkholderia megapolitana]SFJ31996.1 Protein of unknown function [Paraburkholderia megapolitana]